MRRIPISIVCVLTFSVGLWLAPAARGAAGRPAAGGLTGDFNGDGYADLAVGVPYEDLGPGNSIVDAGAVNVLFGSAAGLSSTGNRLWHQDVAGIPGIAESGDGFGTAVTAGDFNGDGYSDLAVGVPYEDLGPGNSIPDAGVVDVLVGSAAGLTATGSVQWSQASSGSGGSAEAGDQFGLSLTSGDFDGDGYSDLAVGVAGQEVSGLAAAGAVDVLYGSPTGLVATRTEEWSQDSTDVLGTALEGDLFSLFSMAAADFGNGPEDDLAIGTPLDGEAGPAASGSVNVLYGSASGLTSAGNQLWAQDTDGAGNPSEEGDVYGFDLAAADFGNGPQADLAIGVPGESLVTKSGAGAVDVLYGGAGGLSTTGSQYWTQNVSGVEGEAGTGDGFGNALAAADFGGGPEADLAVAVAGDRVDGVSAGAVNVLFGSATGLSSDGDQLWSQDSDGIVGVAEDGDAFGYDVAAADFGNGPQADLAVGAALEDLGPGNSIVDAGMVNAIYGSASGLSSTGNQLWTQDSGGIVGVAESGDLFGYGFGYASTSGGGTSPHARPR